MIHAQIAYIHFSHLFFVHFDHYSYTLYGLEVALTGHSFLELLLHIFIYLA